MMAATQSALRRPLAERDAPLIDASILGADFATMGDDCARVLEAGADLLHLDVMDGHFVPNLTMGPDLCKALRRRLPDATLDVHLMVTDPARWIEPFAQAGADHITFHLEPINTSVVHTLIERIRDLGMSVGLAVNPATPVEQLEGYLNILDPESDMALIMSVQPGYAGQAFRPEVLRKVAHLRDHGWKGWIQLDGGVAPDNAPQCREAGADLLVAASSIFKAEDYTKAINALRG